MGVGLYVAIHPVATLYWWPRAGSLAFDWNPLSESGNLGGTINLGDYLEKISGKSKEALWLTGVKAATCMAAVAAEEIIPAFSLS